MKITIIAKEPLGGRCKLYLKYAEALAKQDQDEIEVIPTPLDAPLPPPALLLDGVQVAPADGVILSPLEICQAIPAPEGSSFLKVLEEIEEKFMQESSL